MNEESVRFTLIGGPTLLIEYGGVRLLTDPTVDQPQTYSVGPTTIAKTTSPAVTPNKLLPMDAVLRSHDQHIDNLDTAGRRFLPHAREARVMRVAK